MLNFSINPKFKIAASVEQVANELAEAARANGNDREVRGSENIDEVAGARSESNVARGVVTGRVWQLALKWVIFLLLNNLLLFSNS